MKRIQKGFTLVELLIVIVVIGILAAMMMMSSTEAVTSAKASNIVSNLRNLKTAVLALYSDNMDKFSSGSGENPKLDDVLKYLSAGTTLPDKGQYGMAFEGEAPYASWFIQHKIYGSEEEKKQIQSKLKGRALSVGLLKEAKVSSSEYDGGTEVYIYVR